MRGAVRDQPRDLHARNRVLGLARNFAGGRGRRLPGANFRETPLSNRSSQWRAGNVGKRWATRQDPPFWLWLTWIPVANCHDDFANVRCDNLRCFPRNPVGALFNHNLSSASGEFNQLPLKFVYPNILLRGVLSSSHRISPPEFGLPGR